MPRNLRNLRKRLGKCRGTQRGLGKCLGKCRGTQRDLRKRLGKCRETQRNLRKRQSIPHETCENSRKHSQKRFDRYEASIDTLPAFFHRTHVTNEAPEMADLDRDSDTPTT